MVEFYDGRVDDFIGLIRAGRTPEWSICDINDKDWWSLPEGLRDGANVGCSVAYFVEHITHQLVPLHKPYDKTPSNLLKPKERRKCISISWTFSLL